MKTARFRVDGLNVNENDTSLSFEFNDDDNTIEVWKLKRDTLSLIILNNFSNILDFRVYAFPFKALQCVFIFHVYF